MKTPGPHKGPLGGSLVAMVWPSKQGSPHLPFVFPSQSKEEKQDAASFLGLRSDFSACSFIVFSSLGGQLARPVVLRECGQEWCQKGCCCGEQGGQCSLLCSGCSFPLCLLQYPPSTVFRDPFSPLVNSTEDTGGSARDEGGS